MFEDLPLDNPKRREILPLMALISEASRLRAYNRALGTHLETLDDVPMDFAEAVIAWAGVLEEKGLL